MVEIVKDSKPTEMFTRFVERRVEQALSNTPAVLIVGPRRTGMTTFVKKIGEIDRTCVTLDNPTALKAAQSDPIGFNASLYRAAIDEIQRAPTCS